MPNKTGDVIADFILGPVSAYVAAWVVILNPWVLWFQQPAISSPDFDLRARPFNIKDFREVVGWEGCTGYPDCLADGTDCHFEREHGVNCDVAAMGVVMPGLDDE